MRVVIDASALAAIVFQEEGSSEIARKLHGATLCAPGILKYELANTALKLARRRPALASELFERLGTALDRRRGIKWHDVQATDVAILAKVTGLSAYDASYLWLAGCLEADLVTLDKRLSAAIGLDSEIAGSHDPASI